MSKALTVTVIAPEVSGYQPLRWLKELSGLAIAGAHITLIGGPTCTRERIAQAFDCPADVYIWTGHGMPGGLAIPGLDGHTEFIQPKWLATLVKCAAPRLFVVAACNSLTRDDLMRSIVESISLKGVNSVGYAVAANDEAAVTFNVELIRMLARGAAVGDAFEAAKEMAVEVNAETGQGLFLLPGLTNGLGEIRERLDRLEEGMARILERLDTPQKRARPKPAGC